MNKFEKFSGKSKIDKKLLTKITGGHSRPLTGLYKSAMVSGTGGQVRPQTMGPGSARTSRTRPLTGFYN